MGTPRCCGDLGAKQKHQKTLSINVLGWDSGLCMKEGLISSSKKKIQCCAKREGGGVHSYDHWREHKWWEKGQSVWGFFSLLQLEDLP